MKATHEELRNVCADQGQTDDTFERGEIITMACAAQILETLKEIRETLDQLIGRKE